MKNLKLFTIVLAALMFTLMGCDCVSIRGTGDYILENRHVEGFTGVSLGIHARIVLEQDSLWEMKIEAQENVLDVIKTEVRGNMLHISAGNICTWDTEPVTIFLKMPEVDRIEIGGSGTVVTKREIRGEDLDLGVSGSGQMMLELSMKRVDVHISGSGEIDIAGSTRDLDIHISGSGECYALNLRSQDADIQISGSGSSKVYAKESLDVSISGSGNVFYKGEPDISTSVSGSGEVRKIGDDF
ncbi:MAG: DUF2807 domain-containing protein [Bacteroidetes bacterium]|nr:DUF2807 domain-containing protein [Bacteroidota bacterium]